MDVLNNYLTELFHSEDDKIANCVSDEPTDPAIIETTTVVEDGFVQAEISK